MHHVAHGLHIGAVVWHERGKPPHRLLRLRVGGIDTAGAILDVGPRLAGVSRLDVRLRAAGGLHRRLRLALHLHRGKTEPHRERGDHRQQHPEGE